MFAREPQIAGLRNARLLCIRGVSRFHAGRDNQSTAAFKNKKKYPPYLRVRKIDAVIGSTPSRVLLFLISEIGKSEYGHSYKRAADKHACALARYAQRGAVRATLWQ